MDDSSRRGDGSGESGTQEAGSSGDGTGGASTAPEGASGAAAGHDVSAGGISDSSGASSMSGAGRAEGHSLRSRSFDGASGGGAAGRPYEAPRAGGPPMAGVSGAQGTSTSASGFSASPHQSSLPMPPPMPAALPPQLQGARQGHYQALLAQVTALHTDLSKTVSLCQALRAENDNLKTAYGSVRARRPLKSRWCCHATR